MTAVLIAYLPCPCGNVLKDKGGKVKCGACRKVIRPKS